MPQNSRHDREDDEPVSKDEFNRRFNVLERRITQLEQKNEALEKQLQKFTAVEGNGITSDTPDPARLQILNIIESLQDEDSGASMEAVKNHAANRGLLRTKAKIIVDHLIEECYVEGNATERVRVVAWPELEDE